MGTWDVGPFDNHAACELLAELRDGTFDFEHFKRSCADSPLDVVRLPSFSGHPICTDLVSVREDVHCESTAQEIHAGVPA
ncbi:DUF4259 domain-containing protein [Corynebacterium striatum]|uniref:DUF4259 domain-containing protein n=1 Tax=Corynebacterium striatum TaxID=43770 RepID=UPI003F7ECF15